MADPQQTTPPASPPTKTVRVPGLGLVQFPVDMSDADMQKAIDSQLSGSSSDTNQPQSVWSELSSGLSSVGNYAKNLWDQVNPIAGAKGVIDAMQAHPVATAVGGPVGAVVAQSLPAQGQLFDRAKQAFKAGHYEDGVRLALDYIVPMFGPSIAKAQDQAASGDIAGSAGTATGVGLNIAAPFVAKGTSAIAPAADAAANTKTAEAMIPSRGPSRIEALNIARNVAPELNDQGVTAFTQQGLSAGVDAKLADAGRGINQAEATVPKTTVFGQNDIVSRLQALKKQLTVSGSSGTVAPTGNKMAVDALDQAITEVQQTGTINIDNITKFRRAWQQTAADMRAYVKNPTKDITSQGASVAAGAWADAADALNDVVETKAPQLGPAYQQWGTFRQAQKVLQAADDAEVLRRTGGTGSGGILGRFFDAAIQSRMPTLAQARLYRGIASAIKNGNANAASAGIVTLGRLGGLNDDQVKQAAQAASAAAGGGQ